MTGQQKLLSLWVWLLLMAALCPGVQYAYSKRGGSFRGRGKSDSSKAPPSQGRGLSKHSLKWAGAAAGMLGGTGTGYGLGFLGRTKQGSGGHYGHKTEQEQRFYYNERQGFRNQSLWRAFVNAAAPAPVTNIFLTLGHVVSFLIAAWIRDIWSRGQRSLITWNKSSFEQIFLHVLYFLIGCPSFIFAAGPKLWRLRRAFATKISNLSWISNLWKIEIYLKWLAVYQIWSFFD